jgi:hypothetical protein
MIPSHEAIPVLYHELVRSTWLRHPAFDLGLLAFAWVPFYLWAAFGLGLGAADFGAAPLSFQANKAALATAIFVALGITYVHRHYTLFVVYGDPGTFATRARAFVVAPLLVFVAVIAARLFREVDLGSFAGQRLSPWVVVLFVAGTWNIWHSVQQRYGIFRIYAGKAGAGLESPAQGKRDRSLVWGMVAATAALVLLFRADTLLGHSRARRSMAAVGHLLEHPVVIGLFALVLVGFLAIFCWWLAGERRARLPFRERVPRLLFLGSTALLFAIFVWHGPIMGYLVFGVAHALEYVAFVHHFGARKFAGRADRSPAALLLRHPWRFAPVLVGSLLAVYLLLRAFHDTDVYLAYYFGTSLLHFLYDGWIWKVRRPDVAKPLGLAGTGTRLTLTK